MQCCPLSGGDDDGPRCELTRIRRARTPHECCECEGAIAPGSQYEITTGCWDGSWSTYKTCMSCREIRNHFACDGWTFTMLWEQLRDSFFPGMVAGGPCMEGLSPEAKARLFEIRTAWLLSEDAADGMRRHRAKLARIESNRWWAWLGMWRQIGRAVVERTRTP